MKKFFFIAIILLLSGFAYVYFFMYNKSHPNYSKMDVEYYLTAETLYSDFTAEKDSKKYLGKVLNIEGVVSKVDIVDSTIVVVFNFEEGMFGNQGVRCTMMPSKVKIDSGNSINIKGLCIGYNETDVLLDHCTVIKDQN